MAERYGRAMVVARNIGNFRSTLATLLQLSAICVLLFATSTSSFSILKRMRGGNPCPDPEKPFPCKSTMTCIPMVYVCDKNDDCEDAYDENPDVCTAVNRPPVEDIQSFLNAESWIVRSMFEGKDLSKVAHGLAVSQTVNDLRRRLGLNDDQTANIELVLEAVKTGREGLLEAIGMPSTSWKDVSFMFSKLIESGFTA